MSIQSILFGTMLNNYFKTTLRSMRKNPLSTFINIFGLAVAIGACMRNTLGMKTRSARRLR